MKNSKIKQNKDNKFSSAAASQQQRTKNSNDLNLNLYNSLKDQKYQLIPFKVILKDVGAIKYAPASVQEWKNSVYTYNSNYMKNLSVYDLNVNDLIKKYFSLYFKLSFFKGKYISRYMRKKRRILLKIYASKAEVKHTNSKALVNIFIVDREKKALYKTIKNIFEVRFLMYIWKSLFLKELKNKDLKNKDLNRVMGYFLAKSRTKKYLGYKLIREYLRLIPRRWKKVKLYSKIKKPLNKDNIKKYLFRSLRKIRFRKYFRFEHYYFDSFDNSKGISMYFKQLIYRYFLNKYKFERILLYRLGIFLKKIYKKKIEFNIINLKSVNFNVDILTSMLIFKIKIRKKKQNPRAGWESLRLQKRTKYPVKIDSFLERLYEGKIIDMSVLENNYRNLNINELIFSPIEQGKLENNKIDLKDSALNKKEGDSKDDILNKSLLSFYKGKSLKDQKASHKNHLADISEIIFNKIIKYKNMGGMKFEISGRLTKRYRADKAVFIRRLFGGLNNLDSSFKRRSSVLLRGYMKSNVNYSILTSKRKIGAFAVKGWISGRYYSTATLTSVGKNNNGR